MNAKTNTPATSKAAARAARTKAAARRATWRKVGTWLTSRSRDIAITAIVIGAFVAVFEGSLYSATVFGFSGPSAIAFALMPDALMVVAAAKMRQVGVTPTQREMAKLAMRFSLAFSVLTNMIAAFLRHADASMITPEMLLVGAVVYHGVVVVFLWLAVETLTKTRADAKARKASRATTESAAAVPAQQLNPAYATN